MANFAGTLAKTYLRVPTGAAPGELEFTYTLSATVYVANGTVNLSALLAPIDNYSPSSAMFSVESSSAAYMCVFTPAANPTVANVGTLQLFTATSTAASGSLTLVVRGRVLLRGPGGVMANIA